jgi:hypothetical protein
MKREHGDIKAIGRQDEGREAVHEMSGSEWKEEPKEARGRETK